MKKVVIFGAGHLGQRIYNLIKNDCEILCFADNLQDLWSKEIFGLKVNDPNKIDWNTCDSVIIATMMGFDEVKEQMIRFGVSAEKIDISWANLPVLSRNVFLHNYAELIKQSSLDGAVAEAGVFRGEFAKEINKEFSERKLYLFDTFEGFPSHDIDLELCNSKLDKSEIEMTSSYLSNTSEEFVLNRMPYKHNVIIRKGFFPETAFGINEKFVFVNLDLDLYNPTLEGMRFFYPKLVEGGCLLVHDYFSYGVYLVDKAISDYEKEISQRVFKLPIGDGYSIAIIKCV